MDVMKEVQAEMARATAKFPTWPTDPLHALAVLGEEFGELTKDMLQLCYEPHKTSRENVRKEAIQTATMALRLAMSLDAYDYKRGPQHSQARDELPDDYVTAKPAPQQRKPLTDDQIIDIGNEEHRAMPAGSDEQDELLAIARAVERAHGIGEAPSPASPQQSREWKGIYKETS